jgi:protein TonB
VRYVVGTDGSVGGCRVTRSSGHAELDETTCRLIEQRFRYRPARDGAGRPVPETVSRTFDWLLPLGR